MNPSSSPGSRLKALIFDLDGTLYRQGPLRRAIALRLLRAYALHPGQGLKVLRALRAYRQALELLREKRDLAGDPGIAQIWAASTFSGLHTEFIAGCVRQWMERAPLAVLSRYPRREVVTVLTLAKARGLRLAVFSDYPAVEKLNALGLKSFFDVIICARDHDVQRFKPDPRGLEVVLARLGVRSNEALYVGDRGEVDARAAASSGMMCLLLNGNERERARWGCIGLSTFSQLSNFLETNPAQWV